MNKTPGSSDVGDVADVTIASGEVVTDVTPSPSQEDAELQLKAVQDQLAKYQHDLNALKSASQKRESALQSELRSTQEKYEKQLRSLMSEEALEEYDKSTRDLQLQEYQRKLAEKEQETQRLQAAHDAYSTFVERGVPANVLAPHLADGVEAVANAAWEWALARQNATEQATPSQTKTATTSQPTPKVVTTTTATPYTGPTWKELIEKYGSEERVWTLIENGVLSTDIIPGMKKE